LLTCLQGEGEGTEKRGKLRRKLSGIRAQGEKNTEKGQKDRWLGPRKEQGKEGGRGWKDDKVQRMGTNKNIQGGGRRQGQAGGHIA